MTHSGMILMMALFKPTQEERQAWGGEGNTSQWLIRLITWQEFVSLLRYLWIWGCGSMEQHQATQEAQDHTPWLDKAKDKRANRLFVNSRGRQLGHWVLSFSPVETKLSDLSSLWPCMMKLSLAAMMSVEMLKAKVDVVFSTVDYWLCYFEYFN